MAARLRQTAAIARNAWADILRSPLYAVGFLTAVLLAGLLPTLDYLSFLEKRELVADSLLALMLMGGAFAAAGAAVGTVGDEIRRGTVVAVISKPVPLWVLLVGKLLGIAAGAGLYALALGCATLWSGRTCADDYRPDLLSAGVYAGAVSLGLLTGALGNFLFSRNFGAVMAPAVTVALLAGFGLLGLLPGPGGQPGWSSVDWRLLPAVVLAWPGMVLVGAVAMVASLRLEAAAALLWTFVVFGLGLTADYLLGRHQAGWPGLVYRLVPNWQPFWVADALAADQPVSWAYVARAGGYAAVYAAGLLVLAAAVFDRRGSG